MRIFAMVIITTLTMIAVAILIQRDMERPSAIIHETDTLYVHDTIYISNNETVRLLQERQKTFLRYIVIDDSLRAKGYK